MRQVVVLAVALAMGACGSSSGPSAGMPGSNHAPPPPAVATTCGGVEAAMCPADQRCVDVPDDGCDPDKGGSDCAGFCEPLHK